MVSLNIAKTFICCDLKDIQSERKHREKEKEGTKEREQKGQEKRDRGRKWWAEIGRDRE